jgi:hypothetical protein
MTGGTDAGAASARSPQPGSKNPGQRPSRRRTPASLHATCKGRQGTSFGSILCSAAEHDRFKWPGARTRGQHPHVHLSQAAKPWAAPQPPKNPSQPARDVGTAAGHVIWTDLVERSGTRSFQMTGGTDAGAASARSPQPGSKTLGQDPSREEPQPSTKPALQSQPTQTSPSTNQNLKFDTPRLASRAATAGVSRSHRWRLAQPLLASRATTAGVSRNHRWRLAQPFVAVRRSRTRRLTTKPPGLMSRYLRALT